MNSRTPTLTVFCLLALPLLAGAQTPQRGGAACDACMATQPLSVLQADLYGFKLSGGDVNADPDVLFSQEFSRWGMGGVHSIAGADISAGGWLLPANFRTPETFEDIFVAFLTSPGRVTMDSSVFTDGGVMGGAHPQVVGSLAGWVGPRVRDDAGGVAVEWMPLQEADSDEIVPACSLSGHAVRQFIIGYNVYRLDLIEFPSPTLDDFFMEGYLDHADVLALDFTVPDPDGLSGSDLDPTDGLRLINPDGMPDTGDETLVFVDDEASDAVRWTYRVQPVVRGDQGFFDAGLVANPGVPSTRLDLDGDTMMESIDIAQDGHVEFIDPSGRGLGLAWNGQILSSPVAGRGGLVIIDEPPCDGTLSIDVEVDCANGEDDDGDGDVDCADSDCDDVPPCDNTGGGGGVIIVLEPETGLVIFGWDETMGAPPYRAHVGRLRSLQQAGTYDHAPHACGLVSSPVALDVPEGDLYFLVSSGDASSGIGMNSLGEARPPSEGDCP